MDVAPASPADELSLAVLAGRMTDGVVILDANACVRFCNPAFLRLIGRPAREITALPVADLLDAPGRVIFCDQWSTRGKGSSDPYLVTWLRGDGSIARTHVLPLPLFDSRGRFDGALAIIVDATAQDELAEELATAKTIIEQSSNVLYRARLEEGFPIEYVSGNVAHFGYTPDKLLSGAVGFADIVYEDDRGRVLEELARHLAQGHREFKQQYRAVAADGRMLWVEDHVFLRKIADGAGIYLEGIVTDVTDARRAKDSLHQALTQTIGAIAATIDKRDPYTAGHQRRVADLSQVIACRLGLGADRVEGIYLGALVHDVGKLAIPVDILTRPGRLGAEEFALVKTHVLAGVDVLKDVAFPWPIIDMVAQHHERLDGSGYPRNLVGDSICLEARIIAVADVFESMSTHRPYRAALSVDSALLELSNGRGSLFDATVVDACATIVREGGGDHQELWKMLEAHRLSGASSADSSVDRYEVARD
jgi:PAS domain S-box-containing protein